jgi:glycosyltransferase involved in cell wall biosynthesis
MNILHWPASYPDPSRNMPYHCIFVEEHIKSVRPFANNRVLFISPDSTKSKKWVERTDTIEFQIPVTRFYFNKNLNLQFLNVFIRLVILIYFFELIFIKKFKPSIIHIHFFTSGTWAMLYSKLFATKLVVTEHWTALIGYPVIGKKRLLEAASIYKKSDWTLPVSTHLMHGIQERTGVNLAYKCSVIHNSVDVSIFNRTAQPILPNQLISVIRLDEQKDIPTMLNTLKIMLQTNPALKLIIIGGGDPTPFQQLAENIGVRQSVEFLGALPKNRIAELMNQSELFILSSIAENSPCVIGEAHCCGLPVVATDVGGVKELIMEGTVVPTKAPELLANAVLNQLAKEVDRRLLSKLAQEKFGYDAIGKEISEVYKKICVA